MPYIEKTKRKIKFKYYTKPYYYAISLTEKMKGNYR